MSRIIEDKFLGRFRETGEVREPLAGEFYLCRDGRVGKAKPNGADRKNAWARPILIPVVDAVALPIRRGGAS